MILDALESDDFSDKDKNWRDNAKNLCELIKNQNEKNAVFPKEALRTLMDNKINRLLQL